MGKGRLAVIRLDVLRILEKQGRTKYWLYKQLGMSYQNFNRMVNNETKSIRYENIETMCLLLNCTPNDLFVITEERSAGVTFCRQKVTKDRQRRGLPPPCGIHPAVLGGGCTFLFLALGLVGSHRWRGDSRESRCFSVWLCFYRQGLTLVPAVPSGRKPGSAVFGALDTKKPLKTAEFLRLLE